MIVFFLSSHLPPYQLISEVQHTCDAMILGSHHPCHLDTWDTCALLLAGLPRRARPQGKLSDGWAWAGLGGVWLLWQHVVRRLTFVPIVFKRFEERRRRGCKARSM